MDVLGISDRLYEALSNDDLWSHPEIVDDVEKLADAYDELKAENDKLTEQCNRLLDKTLELGTEYARLKDLLEDSEHDESIAWDRTCKAEAENAKLRELVRQKYTCPTCGNLVFPPNSSVYNTELISLIRDMYTCIDHIDDYDCTGCPLDDTEACDFEGRMIAMGIEVD